MLQGNTCGLRLQARDQIPANRGNSKDTNLFLILINPPLIINNKSGNPKIPHEQFNRGCTNFKRSQTIMN